MALTERVNGDGRPLRAAVIGCGPRGLGHARAYGMTDAWELVACCDVDETRLASVADRFHVPLRFTSVADMLRETDPDLVDVATPATVRWSVIEPVLEAAPPALLVEKPLAVRPSDGYRIVDACRAAGVALQVNHQLRHLAPLRRFRDLLRGGAIGNLRHVRATSRWSLLEHGTHLFDLVDFLVGDGEGFDRVVAQAEGVDSRPGLPDAPEYACGVAAHRRGVHVYFECGPAAPSWPGLDSPWHQLGVELVGSRGTAGCSLNNGWWCRSANVDADETYVHDEEDDAAQVHLLEGIAHSVAGGPRSPAGSGASSAAASFDIVMAAQRAALWRGWVDVRRRVDDDEIDALRAAQYAAAPG